MSDALPLRPYQAATIDAITAAWDRGLNRAAAVLPTGSGKTVIFSHLAKHAHQQGRRTLILAHRDELLRQAADKIRAVAPGIPVGIVKAAENEHADAAVIIASVQTLARPNRRAQIENVGVMVVDEAHHAAADTYRATMGHFGAWRGLPVAGLTATMVRQDGGLAEVWPEVVYRRDVLEMIADRFLVDVRGKAVQLDGLDLDTVASSGGDFQDGALGAALDHAQAAQAIADAYRQHAADRPGILFSPTVETAHSFAEALTAAGIPAAAVWGAMPADQRADVLKRYADRDLQVLTNCAVLTEGFDAPWASCVVIARPTRSVGLYVQMVGRVLRPFPGKDDALVLDLTGASTRHKLASIVDLTGRQIPQPQEGESLAEAEARGAGTPVQHPAGALGWVDVNLFGTSASAWLRTRGGAWFIPAGTAYYLLAPGVEPETLRVWRWTKAEKFQAAPNARDLPLEYAMRWAELYADRRARPISHRDAGWRSRPASPAQLETCRRFRVPTVPGMTQGAASDAIAMHFASNVIDPFITAARTSAAA